MNTLFAWHKEPPQDWVAALARFTPRTENASHLVLFWESGTPREPAQRWVIYEATPLRWVQPWRLEAFRHEQVCRCPYEAETHAQCPRCGGVQSPGRMRILRYLQQTECLALPYWVVQGTNGGHRRRYTQIEQQWAAMVKQPETPPETGDLPYAPLDQRVFRRLRAFDRAMRAYRDLASCYDAEKEGAEIAYRTALADYVDTGFASRFDELSRARRASLIDELPRDFTKTPVRVDYAAERESFIHRKD